MNSRTSSNATAIQTQVIDGKSAMTNLVLNPVCQVCTRGCGTKKMTHAMSLLAGWEHKINDTIKLRKRNYSIVSEEEKELHYLTFWYQSGSWKPCLYRCLIGAVNTILLLAVDREKLVDADVNEWIAGRTTYGEAGLPASAIVHGANTSMAWHMLDCALAYWIEAALAHDSNEPELAWQPLLQAQMYIGMAAGPISHREMGDRGRDAQHAPSWKLRNIVLTALKSFADKQFEHSKETLEAIVSAKPIEDFQEGNEGFDDIAKVVRSIRSRDPQVMVEFDRVTVQAVRRGRPPKPKNHDRKPKRKAD